MPRQASRSATLPIAHLVLRFLVAWTLLVLQLLGMILGGIGDAVSTPAHPVDVHAGFSISGWLAVFLTFLLARVFTDGTRMREDLQGTV